MRKYYAETLGTFALVFMGTGAIIVDSLTEGLVTHPGIALTFGLVVLAAVYSLGGVSGAHINPAVTLGFWLARRFEGKHVVPYVLAQCLGALAASGLLRILFPDHATLGGTLPAGSAWQSFLLEVILTWFLMFVVLGLSTGAKEKGMMAGVAVGAVVALEAMFAGPISGASMNPARSLGPALASGTLGSLWIYLVAPPLGAALAVVSHNLLGENVMEQNSSAGKRNVLILCTGNSCRSQMAEGLWRQLGNGQWQVASAGSQPAGYVHPQAIAVMQEIGVDLQAHRSQHVNEHAGEAFDLVVTVCDQAREACPVFPGAVKLLHWPFDDPAKFTGSDEEVLAEFRRVRDEIRVKISDFLNTSGD